MDVIGQPSKGLQGRRSGNPQYGVMYLVLIRAAARFINTWLHTIIGRVGFLTGCPQEQVVRGAREAEALPEEVNPDSSCLEAEVEELCGRGYRAWQKQNAPEVLNIKTGFAQVVE